MGEARMSAHSAFATSVLVQIGKATNRTLVLPMLLFYPTSRCNSRCISCDWWKQTGEGDLTIDEIAVIAEALPALGTRLVAFSGGEPLLRPDVFHVAALFRAHGVDLHLLTSGVLLERHAESVAEYFGRVTVSLDATTEESYQAVRGVAALGTVGKGVERLRQIAPCTPVTARATLHRANFRELPRLIDQARTMRFDGISFLAADLSSTAFGRRGHDERPPLDLDADAVAEFEDLVERTIIAHQVDFESGFILDSPRKLRRLPRYYAALAGQSPFPENHCNAPWVSVVIEADGDVRPCFFHPAIGNIRRAPLEDILGDSLRSFRDSLDVQANAVCERCVCSIKTSWRSAPWQ
jgi:MoaA/NifB/PqqE/SkfB family radical SAM enzyme